MSVADEVRRELRQAGFANSAIDAAWPEWWSSEAEQSLSATTELRYTIARRLGLSPQSLFEGPPRFVWRDHARYKNLGAEHANDLQALSSFGVALARTLTAGTVQPQGNVSPPPSYQLRELLLHHSAYVNLQALLAACWSLGIPVVHLDVLPLEQKRMHAMSARVQERTAILLARRSPYPSQVAYAVAHELGHIALQHLRQDPVLLHVQDPLQAAEQDEEEASSDSYALELLTGDTEPTVLADTTTYTGPQLADAAIRHAREYSIEPGILALCAGYSTGRWAETFSALNWIPPGKVDVASMVNGIAADQIDWGSLPASSAWYLRQVMGLTS